MSEYGSLHGVDIETRLAIQELVTEHSHRVDHGLADRLAELYTEDGELLGLPPENLIGRQAIQEWSRNRVALTGRTSRHVESNLRVVWDGETLRGLLTVVMYRSDTPDVSNTVPQMVGNYDDEYALVDGSWLIRRRTIRRAFFASGLATQPKKA